jgi:DNA-binding response OmpR family regulator
MSDEILNILIVDDNAQNLQLIGNLLSSGSIQVEFAEDGKSAIQWINEEQFDLVLLDIMMPGIDGFEVLDNIRKLENYDNVPVILLTAKSGKENIIRGLNSKANDYITKPFDSDELIARVNTHLELRKSRKKLAETNKSLEIEVKKRTAELERTVARLSNLNKKLEESELLKNTYLNLISNELKGPLSEALSSFQIIKDRYVSEELMEVVNSIEDSLSKISAFSASAELYASVREGRFEKENRTISLRTTLNNTIHDLSDHLRDNNTSIEFVNDSDIQLVADQDLLNTAFNAIFIVMNTGYDKGKEIKIQINPETRSMEFTFSENSNNDNCGQCKIISSVNTLLAKEIIEAHNGTLHKNDLNSFYIEFE